MRKQLVSLSITIVFMLMANVLPADENCGKILEEKCTECHYNTRICEKVGKKSKRSWKNSVKRMIRYGLEISDVQVNEITGCLVSLEREPEPFCK